MYKFLIILILGLSLSLTACDSTPPEPRLSIEEAWARPPVTEGGNGAIYFRLVNEGGKADTLLDVSSPVATAELHQTVMKENDVMGMEPLARVEIPAGDAVDFKQGGMHVMLIGVEQPMPVGGTIPITLQFRHVGKIQSAAEVRQP
jgi:copper(I)-binding protein